MLKIGVVGYCPPTRFDEVEARRALNDLLNQASEGHDEVTLVSGLTDVGVLGLAYHIARERGWKTSGIACARALEHPLFPVDEQKIVGTKWGDESEAFLRECDVLVRVGGGKQSLAEVAQFKSRGGTAYEFDLAALPS